MGDNRDGLVINNCCEIVKEPQAHPPAAPKPRTHAKPSLPPGPKPQSQPPVTPDPQAQPPAAPMNYIDNGGNKIKIGDHVEWIGYNSDIPNGAKGIVTELRTEREKGVIVPKVIVDYGTGGIWYFDPTELRRLVW